MEKVFPTPCLGQENGPTTIRWSTAIEFHPAPAPIHPANHPGCPFFQRFWRHCVKYGVERENKWTVGKPDQRHVGKWKHSVADQPPIRNKLSKIASGLRAATESAESVFLSKSTPPHTAATITIQRQLMKMMKIDIEFISEQPILIGVISRQIFPRHTPHQHGRRPSLFLQRASQPQLDLRWDAKAGDGQPAARRPARESRGVLVLSDFEV